MIAFFFKERNNQLLIYKYMKSKHLKRSSYIYRQSRFSVIKYEIVFEILFLPHIDKKRDRSKKSIKYYFNRFFLFSRAHFKTLEV